MKYNLFLKQILVLGVLLLPAGGHLSLRANNHKSNGNAKQQIIDIIEKVNDYWQTNNPAEVRSFWDNAAYHTGNMEFYRLLCSEEAKDSKESGGTKVSKSSKAKDYLDYSMRWANYNNWMGATEPDTAKWLYKTYGEDQQHVLFGDWQICFQTYIDLYNINTNHNANWINRAKEVMGHEMHSKAHDYWWWADALYMVMPVMTKMYLLTGDEGYLDKLYENLCYTDSLMYDQETGLYFRDARYVYPLHKTVAGKRDYWARGDGWVLAGLAKILGDLKWSKGTSQTSGSKTKYIKFFEEKFIRLAKAVAKLQQDGGYWTRSMMDPEQAPGYETSGTAFFTYGMLWGVNNGLLSKEDFKPVIEKAWHYLTVVALQPSGKVGYVQPIGDRAIPGQIINQNSEANFGVGAFLLAATEYYRYQ